jgi:pimeloyl-ACP methyl ester carboxylesterase
MRGFELDAGFEARVLAALAALDCPAQVLWGDRDAMLDVAVHGEAARAALGCEISLLPAKHFVPEDAPTEIARRVAALAEIRAG